MTRCPGCRATLPDGATVCQFCGRAVGGPPPIRLGGLRPTPKPTTASGAPPWAATAYRLIAVYWIFSGAWGVLSSTLLAGDSGPSPIGATVSLLPVVVGLGLLARVEFVRGIVNVLCALQILGGLLGIFTAFLAGMPVAMLLAIVQVLTAGFMIYLIGETDTRGPNL